jgi:hypothetical protein
MAAPRRVIELAIGADELSRLEAIARSRTEAASRVERARILLAYRSEPSSTAVGAVIGVTHHTVQRCLRRAVRLGVMAALHDSPRPGKPPQITDAAKAWLVSLACQKAKDLGYPHELWTNPAAGATRPHACRRRRTCLSDARRPGHGLQDTRRTRDQAAQGPLLPGTPRRGLRDENG